MMEMDLHFGYNSPHNQKGVSVTRSELLVKLSNVKDELRQQFGIEEIALFGSYARDEAGDDSDVDIVILESSRKNFVLRMKAIDFLKEYLQKDVDMGYFDSMKTFVKNRIQKDLIVV
jgi:predicted nucleotidyltransferase